MRVVARLVSGGIASVAALALGGASLTQPAAYTVASDDERGGDQTLIIGPADPYEAIVPGQPIRSVTPSASATVIISGAPPAMTGNLPIGAGGRVLAASAGDLGIPALVLEAYQRAAEGMAAQRPGCGIRWQILAGVGQVESRHANGGSLTATGDAVPRILGPILDGNGFAAISDSDGGRWDGDTTWDRAVGPMQFIPGTWALMGADGSGDGIADPNNVFDATLAAARYLCHGGEDLSTDAGLASALRRYNNSSAYVALVMSWIAAYDAGEARAVPNVGPGARTPATALAPPPPPSPSSPRPAPKPPPTPIPPPAPEPPGQTPTPNPTRTAKPSPSPEPTRTATPSPKPTLTTSPTPSPTPDPTPSPTPSPTPDPSPTPTPTPSPEPEDPEPEEPADPPCVDTGQQDNDDCLPVCEADEDPAEDECVPICEKGADPAEDGCVPICEKGADPAGTTGTEPTDEVARRSDTDCIPADDSSEE